MKLSAAVLVAAATLFAFAAPAGAVDGTIEINQAKVMAAGGFPYTITTSGSYRLTGQLTVSSTTTDAIDVNTSNVTIDLNGFLIVGPGASSAADGINATSVQAVTVENGLVIGFKVGVSVGLFGIVRNVHADKNVNIGIQGANNTVVQGCTANNTSEGYGIECSGGGCAISGNTANGNVQAGINCTGNGCVISNNTAIADGLVGIACGSSGCLISGNTAFNNLVGIGMDDATSGYGGNVMDNNSTSNHSGGTSLGNNLCSGTVC
ncbi:MAG: hypothetical protein ABSD30_06305 [Candidatus Binatus sp.]|jgi:hypothetical protein